MEINKNGIMFYDHNGKLRLFIGLDEKTGTPRITLHDKNGWNRLIFTLTDGNEGDEDGSYSQ